MTQAAEAAVASGQAGFVRAYARALAAVLQAQSADEAQAVQMALQGLAAAVERGGLSELLQAPGRTRVDRARLLVDQLGDSLPPTVRHLLQLLAEHGRLASLSALSAALSEEMRRRQGQLRATVACAAAPQQDEKQQLQQRLEQLFLPPQTDGSLELEFHTDAALIGGFVARCGDRVIDASLAGRLERLHQAVSAA